MATPWYFIRNGKECGPFSGHLLRELALAGRLTANDQVRKGESGEPVAATHVKGLFAEDTGESERLAPPPPPLPVSSRWGLTHSWSLRAAATVAVGLTLLVVAFLIVGQLRGTSGGGSQTAGDSNRGNQPAIAAGDSNGGDQPATAADDNDPSIWLLERPTFSIDAKYSDLGLQLSEDGEYLLVNGNQLWRIGARGEESSSPLPQQLAVPHQRSLTNLTLSRDGRVLAGVNAPEAKLVLFNVDGDRVQDVGAAILRGKRDEDLNTASHPLRANTTISNWHTGVLWSPDSSFVVTIYNWSVQIVSAQSSPSIKAEFSSPLNAADGMLHSIPHGGVVISHDGAFVAVRFETRPPTVSVLDRHGRLITTLEFSGAKAQDVYLHGFSDDGEQFFANAGKEGLTVWDTTKWEKVASLGPDYVLRWCDSGRQTVVVSDSSGGRFREWSLPERDFERQWTERLTRGDMYGSFSPDGRFGVFGWDDGQLEVWDLEHNALLGALAQADGQRRHNMVISGDKSTIATNPAGSSTVEIWRWAEGRDGTFSEYAATRR